MDEESPTDVESLSNCDADLLAKLEEQNRVLESDAKGLTRVPARPSSLAKKEDSKPHKSGLNLAIEQVVKKLTSLSGSPKRGSNQDVPNMPTTEEDIYLAWGAIIANWEETFHKRPKYIKQLVRDGIPDAVRALAWQLLSNAFDSPMKDTYVELMELPSPSEKQIQRDIARTFPQHSFFKDHDGVGQESLFHVVKAYSLHDKEVGYCQGSSFIVGILLMQMPEEEAFAVFVKIMQDYGMRRLFTPTMSSLNLCFYLLEALIQESLPDLYTHFQAQGFFTSMWSSSWFLTMFATTLPLCIVFRIMDLFLLEGMEILFRVGVALLEWSREQLLQMDMEAMLRHFQKDMCTIHERDPEALIAAAYQVKYNTKKMKRLEKEYEVMRERASQEHEENRRLRTENKMLQDRVNHLELESTSLAGRLIEGQVNSAQEAEDLFAMRRELAGLRKHDAEVAEKLREAELRVSELEQINDVVEAMRRDTTPSDVLENGTAVKQQNITLCESSETVRLRAELTLFQKKDQESTNTINMLQREVEHLRKQLAKARLTMSSSSTDGDGSGSVSSRTTSPSRQSPTKSIKKEWV